MLKITGIKEAIGSMLLVLAVFIFCQLPLSASAPPVRVGVVTGGGSGIEQEIVDRITMRLEENPNVKVSTVNPDWYVVCNIKEFMDQMSGQIRYNGNVLIKTASGTVIDTVAVQQYKQDFSLTPGAPLNKALVDKAAREAISGAADRAVPKIERHAEIEMETRSRIIKAQMMAEQEEYNGAINALRLVSPDSTHFKNVRALMEEFAMEADAQAKVKQAEANAAQHKYAAALAILKNVPAKSRYKKRADQLAASYRAAMRRPAKPVAKKKPTAAPAKSAASDQTDLKALDKALELQKKAIEEKQAKIRSKLNSK